MTQTLQTIEIICVDDASPDGSAAIVKTLAREDGRIRLIQHERNLGLGGARNTGITAARAPYVTGIDSDDYIQPEMMERLWQASEAGMADIVACGFARVNHDGTCAGPSYTPEPGLFINDHHQVNIFEFFNPSFCNKIWRKSLFIQHNIAFPEHTYFEDLAVMPQLVNFATRIRVIPGEFYRYHIRAGSTTQSYSAKHIIDHFKVFDILDEFLAREGLVERYGADFVVRICRSLSFHASNVLSSSMDEKDKEQYLRLCLMLKLAYLDLKSRFRDVPSTTLQSLLQAVEGDPSQHQELSTLADTSGSAAQP